MLKEHLTKAAKASGASSPSERTTSLLQALAERVELAKHDPVSVQILADELRACSTDLAAACVPGHVTAASTKARTTRGAPRPKRKRAA